MNNSKDYMALAFEMKAQSNNKNRQVGAAITNGVAAHNRHVSLLERRTTAVHAEATAICQCAAEGPSTKGHEIYVTLSPCVACAKLIVDAGITAVYFHTLDLEQLEAINILHSCDVKVHGPLEETE